MKRGHLSTRPIGTLEPPSISTQNDALAGAGPRDDDDDDEDV